MRVFVASEAGAIGSNVVDHLIAPGYDVANFDSFSNGQAKFLKGAQGIPHFRLVRDGDAAAADFRI
jgi:nucleoside-diphosphate-sugar epimerase